MPDGGLLLPNPACERARQARPSTKSSSNDGSPEVSHHQRLGRRIDLPGLERMALQPVESIRAQEDEVNDERKDEEEREEPDEGASRIEE
jgi:hypothetical protein